MALILAPLSFLVIGYGLIYALSYPMIRPLYSIYSLISNEFGPNANKESSNIYNNKVGSESGIVNFKDIKIPSIGDIYGELSIGKINLKLDLYFGDSNEILEVGAGQFAGSYLPGFNRTVMIAGHTVPYFQRFGELAKSDVVQISTSYGVFTYKITDVKVGDFNDSSMYDLSQDKKEQLILYTCYPLDGIGFKQQRLFVYADKVSGPTVSGV